MKLKKWLSKTGITVTAMADLVGIDRSYLHAIISGRKVPSPGLINKINKTTLGCVVGLDDIQSSVYKDEVRNV